MNDEAFHTDSFIVSSFSLTLVAILPYQTSAQGGAFSMSNNCSAASFILKLVLFVGCSLVHHHVYAFSQKPTKVTPSLGADAADAAPVIIRNSADYASYWEELLLTEYRQAVEALREKRQAWSRKQLEDSGISVFGASAVPDSELLGEKIVRITQRGGAIRTWRDIFSRGDVLLLTPEMQSQRQFGANKYAMSNKDSTPIPKECLVVDVGKDWMTVGVGASWPAGLWESRKFHYEVRLDRAAPQAPLRAQRAALDRVKRNQAGPVARHLAAMFDASVDADKLASQAPYGNKWPMDQWEQSIRLAMSKALEKTTFLPNDSQRHAIEWTLKRRISLVRGPPGTGKTKTAALLIATALGCQQSDLAEPGQEAGRAPRVLAVTHSNGAADVLLEGLLQIGVAAVRLGRPASVSASLQHRTTLAMAEKMPLVVQLRGLSRDMTLSSQERSAAAFELRQAMIDMQQMILETAPVVVTSCIGAYQLLQSEDEKVVNDEKKVLATPKFPLVVLDEAAQTTEPALICALAAAQAEQLILVGDTRQLPPTITCMSLLNNLGVSPMARLEACGVGEVTLKTQYRMPPALLRHPSKYFYNGSVKCAPELMKEVALPDGFRWPSPEPLAFVQVGDGDSEVAHAFGGRSNPTEARRVIKIVSSLLDGGDVEAKEIAIISPYAKQVQLIRSELSTMRNTQGIRVGSVDAYQGQEAEIVIFSAVRSNAMKELGFLRDSRRLCVAITRARRGLILVGDQATLKACRHWEALIDSLKERDCITKEENLSEPLVLPDDSLDDLLAESDVMKRLFGEEDDIFDLASLDIDD